MEYLPLVILVLAIISFAFGAIKMFQNKNLKSHRKGFWFFIFLTIPVFGPFIYFSSTEYKQSVRHGYFK